LRIAYLEAPQAAEDQECKEAVLAYHFIYNAEPAATAGKIAVRIETWLARTFGINLDFKSVHALETLNRFGLLRRDGERLFVPARAGNRPIAPSLEQFLKR
jgi:hypothetical protein